MHPRFPSHRRLTVATALVMLAAGCAVGPDYQRPATVDVSRYKEAEGWVPALPADALERGPWWLLFGDPLLDQLQSRVEVSNQNVAVAVAAYAQARALVRVQQASLFPTVTLNGGSSRSKSSSSTTGSAAGFGGRIGNSYQLGIGGFSSLLYRWPSRSVCHPVECPRSTLFATCESV